MSLEKELEIALGHFEDRLTEKGFVLSLDAKLSLREYIMEKKRKERIFSQIERKERTSRNLVEGFGELAAVASQVASSDGRRTVTRRDVTDCIRRVFCKVWPFCE